MIERRQRIAAFDFVLGQDGRHVGLGVAVLAVLGDRQATAQRVQCAVGIGVAEGGSAGVERE